MRLITGVTGNNGSAILRQCSAEGLEVRGLIRDRSKAEALGLHELPHVTLVEGDMRHPQTLATAFLDVEICVMISGARQDLVATQSAFIDAAKAAGVRHVVKFSGAESGIGFDPMGFRGTRVHEAAEQYLRDSGLLWTMLRPSQFMQMYLHEPPRIAEHGALIRPMGGAALSPIDIEDIAKIVVQVLAGAEDLHGESFDMTGPESLTMAEIAEAISGVLARPISYIDIAPSEYVAQLTDAGTPPDTIAVLDEIYAERRRHPLSHVKLGAHERFGVHPTTFAEFARLNAAKLRPALAPE